MNLDVIREVALFEIFPQPTESIFYCDRLCSVNLMSFEARAVIADSDNELFVHGRISFVISDDVVVTLKRVYLIIPYNIPFVNMFFESFFDFFKKVFERDSRLLSEHYLISAD